MKGKGYTHLTIPQARQLLMEDRRATLVDTRSPGEYRRGTLPGAVSIPPAAAGYGCPSAGFLPHRRLQLAPRPAPGGAGVYPGLRCGRLPGMAAGAVKGKEAAG